MVSLPTQPSQFPVGHKVICIRDDFPKSALRDFSDLPRKGQIYTIAAVGWGTHVTDTEYRLGIVVHEIPRRVGAGDAWLCLRRFRLLADQCELDAMIQPVALSA